MIARIVFALGLIGFVVSAQQKKSEPLASAAIDTAAPSGGAADVAAAVDLKTFVIGPDDVVGVKVWREPELSSTLRVRPDGKITLPLGGEVKAAGRTPEQLGQEITKMLGSFVNNPLVMVSVLEVRSKKYSITGEVSKPGAYPLITPTTVLDAILQAGGFKEYAKKKKITIMRNGEQLKFNYGDYVKNKKLAQNVQLQDGDLIVVP